MQQGTRGCVPVVEHHADTRRFLTRLLAMSRYTAYGAGSLGEAVQVARRERCPLLATDLGLPDGPGLDLFGFLPKEYDVKGNGRDRPRGGRRARRDPEGRLRRTPRQTVTFDKLLDALKALET